MESKNDKEKKSNTKKTSTTKDNKETSIEKSKDIEKVDTKIKKIIKKKKSEGLKENDTVKEISVIEEVNNINADLEKNNSANDKKFNIIDFLSKKWMFIIILIIVLMIVVIFLQKMVIVKEVDDSREKVEVENMAVIKEKFGQDIILDDVKNKTYYIEDEDIARIEFSDRGMDFVLKFSSDGNKTLPNLFHEWDIPIRMRVTCPDGSDIEVTAFTAMDDPKIMKANWYDNDVYYSMDTKNLYTRENFLQEIYHMILANHVEFEDEE